MFRGDTKHGERHEHRREKDLSKICVVVRVFTNRMLYKFFLSKISCLDYFLMCIHKNYL